MTTGYDRAGTSRRPLRPGTGGGIGGDGLDHGSEGFDIADGEVGDPPAIAAPVDLGHDLLNRSDQHIRRLRNINRAEAINPLDQPSGRCLRIVGDLHDLDQRVEFESVESLSSTGPHLLELSVKVIRGPLDVVPMPIPERPPQPLKADDVCVGSGVAEQGNPVTANQDGQSFLH